MTKRCTTCRKQGIQLEGPVLVYAGTVYNAGGRGTHPAKVRLCDQHVQEYGWVRQPTVFDQAAQLASLTKECVPLIPRLELRKTAEAGVKYGEQLTDPKDFYQTFKSTLDAPQELFLCVALDRKNTPIGYEVLFKGAMDAATVDPRIVFQWLMLTGASAFIIGHNHPSGDPQPSNDDRRITLALRDGGKVLGCQLIDHIVFGDDGFVSLSQLGWL